MINPYIEQRMRGLQSILNGIYQSSIGLATATIGSAREGFVNNFLAHVLPPIYRFGKGDVTDINGNKSGQLDIVIEYPFSPSIPITATDFDRLYLAESVAAVVEIKSDIANQWEQAVQTAQKLSPIRREFGPSLIMNYAPSSQIPLFVAGFTGWKTLPTAVEHLEPCHHIAGILVIDSGLYVSRVRNQWWQGPLALWAFICDLHLVTNSLQSAATDPLKYISNFEN